MNLKKKKSTNVVTVTHIDLLTARRDAELAVSTCLVYKKFYRPVTTWLVLDASTFPVYKHLYATRFYKRPDTAKVTRGRPTCSAWRQRTDFNLKV